MARHVKRQLCLPPHAGAARRPKYAMRAAACIGAKMRRVVATSSGAPPVVGGLDRIWTRFEQPERMKLESAAR